ncbi:MAG TPA: tetratricopeptide repeat protein [Vicinamibacterales bacterium]
MKQIERHKLKENELARTLAGLNRAVEGRGNVAAKVALGVLVLVLVALGFSMFRQRGESRGQELLADAMVALNARVVPASAAGPEGEPAAAQIGATGAFSTEQAKLTAAIPKLQAAADGAPGTTAGITARYYLGGALAAVGRHDEAIKAFEDVTSRAGADTLYGRMARMGRADAQLRAGQVDAAIAGWKDLMAQQGDELPADALLLELARAYRLKGDSAEAKKTLTQLVDDHPNSPYAPEARADLQGLSGS